MVKPPRYSRRRTEMNRHSFLNPRRLGPGFIIQNKGYMIPILGIMLLALLLTACSGPFSSGTPTPTSTTTTSGGAPAFPTTALALRTPAFGTPGQVAPTVKVLASADPTLIVQFP